MVDRKKRLGPDQKMSVFDTNNCGKNGTKPQNEKLLKMLIGQFFSSQNSWLAAGKGVNVTTPKLAYNQVGLWNFNLFHC